MHEHVEPGVLLAAGLLAKKAVERGLTVKPHIKTSLAPGSRVVTEYLRRPACCRTSRSSASTWRPTAARPASATPAARPAIKKPYSGNDLICAAVLSGNRNFEARIHPNIKANFLMSPPLVVAFAIAGTINIDLITEPLGTGKDGEHVYLSDIWPSQARCRRGDAVRDRPETYRRLYADFAEDHPLWNDIPGTTGQVYNWDKSTYIAEPPFFDDFSMQPVRPGDVHGRARARHLRRLGHHRSHHPAGCDQADVAGRPVPAGAMACAWSTSTATARAAATTR